MLKVLLKPCNLSSSIVSRILTTVIVTGRNTFIVHIIHHDVVALSNVERIVVRSKILSKLQGFRPIFTNFHLIVMVTHCVEHCHVSESIVDCILILGKSIVVVQPIHLPSHITESKDINLSWSSIHSIVYISRNLSKLLDIICPVCKVHVTKYQKSIILTWSLLQFEIYLLHSLSILRKKLVVHREHALDREVVACRIGYKHITTLLVRLKNIISFSVSLDDFITVRNKYVRHSCAVAGHHTIDISCCRLRLNMHTSLLNGNSFLLAIVVCEYDIAAS